MQAAIFMHNGVEFKVSTLAAIAYFNHMHYLAYEQNEQGVWVRKYLN